MNAAAEARKLILLRCVGALATNSLRSPGWPYSAMLPYAVDASGRPLFLISTLAAHTKDLLADPRASLQITADLEEEIARTPRMTLMGKVEPVPAEDWPAARAAYFESFPEAESWAHLGDFAFYRLEPVEIHYVGGFAAAAWVTPADYLSALG